MKVYKGLPHQKGYGAIGSLLKFGAPIVGGLIGEVVTPLVGKLIKKKIQRGSGIRDLFRTNVARIDRKIRGAARRKVQSLHGRAMRAASGKAALQSGIQALGNTAMDLIDRKRSLGQGLRHYGTHALKLTGNKLIEQNLNPLLSKPVVGPILKKTVMPIVRRKVDSEGAVQNVLGQRGKGAVTEMLKKGIRGVAPMMKSGVRAILRRGVKKQTKGAKQLAQTATQEAIRSAAKAGVDVLRGKNAKQAVQQRTSQAVKRTYDQVAAPVLAQMAPVKKKK